MHRYIDWQGCFSFIKTAIKDKSQYIKYHRDGADLKTAHGKEERNGKFEPFDASEGEKGHVFST